MSKEVKQWTERLKRAYLSDHNEMVEMLSKTLPNHSHIKVSSGEDYAIFIPRTLTENNPIPLLCAHTDTVFKEILREKDIRVKHKRGSTYIRADNPFRGVGGDDRNGCAILLEVAKHQPNDFIYALFNFEESGCIGSHLAAPFIAQMKEKISCLIGLDRTGLSGDFVAIYGGESKELLDMFAGWEWGSITDVAVLADELMLSCINLPVGYYCAHQAKEYTIVEDVVSTYNKVLTLPEGVRGTTFPRRYSTSRSLGSWGCVTSFGDFRNSHRTHRSMAGMHGYGYLDDDDIQLLEEEEYGDVPGVFSNLGDEYDEDYLEDLADEFWCGFDEWLWTHMPTMKEYRYLKGNWYRDSIANPTLSDEEYMMLEWYFRWGDFLEYMDRIGIREEEQKYRVEELWDMRRVN